MFIKNRFVRAVNDNDHSLFTLFLMLLILRWFGEVFFRSR